MTQRRQLDGWASVLGDELEDEKTNPDLVQPCYVAAPAAEKARPSPAPSAKAGPPPRLAIPPGKTEVDVPPALPSRRSNNVSLPPLESPSSVRTPPLPAAEGLATRPARTAPETRDRSAAAPAFSEQVLLDRLQASAPKPTESDWWREYGPLAIIVSAGVVLLGGYLLVRSPPPVVEQPTRRVRTGAERNLDLVRPAPASADPTISVPSPAPPSPAQGKDQPAHPTTTAKIEKAAVSMLSILSDPPGADVEIEGEVVGKTPFIRQSPVRDRPLSVKVVLPGYRPWAGEVTPNAAGHYEAKAELEPGPK